MWQLLLYCHMQPRAALKLARIALSHTRSHIGLHYLALDTTRSHSQKNSFKLAHPHSSTCWLALA